MTAETQAADLTPEQIADDLLLKMAWAELVDVDPADCAEIARRQKCVIADAVRSAVMAEREACARVADTTTANGDGAGLWPYGYGMAKTEIAEAIRARSTETDHDR